MRVSIILIGLGLVLGVPTSASALDPGVKCEAAKVKETASYYACRLKAESKAIKKLTTPDFSKCDSKYSEKWKKAESKAGGACPTEGDEAAIRAQMIGDSDSIVAILAGVGVGFVDNGDGTVTDNQTGLMWEKKVAGSGCLHCMDDDYVWVDAMSDWISEVNGHIDDPDTQAGLGGHTDWRLPTSVELQTIVDLSQGFCGGAPFGDPCIDPIFGPTASSPVWSSSTTSSDPNNAWEVNFIDGVVNFSPKGLIFQVRAVRGSP